MEIIKTVIAVLVGLGIILLPAVFAGYITNVLSRISRKRNRRPSWLIIPLAAASCALVSCLFIYQVELFQPKYWDREKCPMIMGILFAGLVSAALGTMGSVIMMLYETRKYHRDKVDSGKANPATSERE